MDKVQATAEKDQGEEEQKGEGGASAAGGAAVEGAEDGWAVVEAADDWEDAVDDWDNADVTVRVLG